MVVNKYVTGSRSETVLIPYSDAGGVYLRVSTRTKNIVIYWGDDTISAYTTAKNMDATINVLNLTNVTKTYSPAFTGNAVLRMVGGVKDVYSLVVMEYGDGGKKNIPDFGTFMAQFTHLYSFVFNARYDAGVATYPVVKGNLFNFPDSVERVRISATDCVNAATDLTMDLSGFSNTSNLKWLSADIYRGNSKLLGDLAKIPQGCAYAYFKNTGAGSAITYTAGKTWASAFDTLYLTLTLTVAETDALLNDMAASITSAVGGKVIYLVNCNRNTASDAAVSYLESLGFTINVSSKRLIYDANVLFRMDMNKNFNWDVYSNSLIDIQFSSNPFGDWQLSGRKAGEYCLNFFDNGIKTLSNLPITGDKITLSMWVKKNGADQAILAELSPNATTNNSFMVRYAAANQGLYVHDRSTVNNIKRGNTVTNDNTWHHVVAVIDRSLGATDSTRIYVDGVLDTTTAIATNTTTGNFGSYPLFISRRNYGGNGYRGSLLLFKIFNRALNATEINDLYNAEL